ncbi:uncharacterized protein [Sagmatias obliquidens]|uniref:uncharacterized protein n=1 Tax=Sagmatias obliquidens TaxID=3371155 RepID=UPI000F4441A0|nr:uncharacterized protein LOC113606354 [Lagenorhynchus obliquidens]
MFAKGADGLGDEEDGRRRALAGAVGTPVAGGAGGGPGGTCPAGPARPRARARATSRAGGAGRCVRAPAAVGWAAWRQLFRHLRHSAAAFAGPGDPARGSPSEPWERVGSLRGRPGLGERAPRSGDRGQRQRPGGEGARPRCPRCLEASQVCCVRRASHLMAPKYPWKCGKLKDDWSFSSHLVSMKKRIRGSQSALP